MRRAVNTILQQTEPPKPNITREQQDALKNLKEDNSMMVLRKGRPSLVLDTDTYNRPRCPDRISKDTTDRLTGKLSLKLFTLKRHGHISGAVNTFAYDLSAFLANILSPLTGNSEFTVTNSAHCVFIISSEKIQDHEIMVSFDV